MDKRIRLEVERKLKLGHLRAVVTSSSLEMGIDIGSVDMVIQVGSPGDIATALQRIGRAGHHVGGIPRARFLPSSVDDLIELAALQAAIQTGEMDRLGFPTELSRCLSPIPNRPGNHQREGYRRGLRNSHQHVVLSKYRL